MSQNTRLLLIALGIIIVFGIFLQSYIARNLQESSNGLDTMPNIRYQQAPASDKNNGKAQKGQAKSH